MNASVLRSKELWAGFLYAALGATGLLLGSSYGFGSTTRMGAGFFPMILCGLLVAVGVVSAVRGLLSSVDDPERLVGDVTLKPVLMVAGAVVAFAWLLPRVGFAVALPAMLLVAAAASPEFRLGWRPLLALTAFCGLCYLLFIRGLGVPMPTSGTLFGG